MFAEFHGYSEISGDFLFEHACGPKSVAGFSGVQIVIF